MYQASQRRRVHSDGTSNLESMLAGLHHRAVLGVTVRCGDLDIQAGCGVPRDDGMVGGFVRSRGAGNCQIPLDELRWCDLPIPASCMPLVMVHELAHTCGWSHDAGAMGVPGASGKLSWRDECE